MQHSKLKMVVGQIIDRSHLCDLAIGTQVHSADISEPYGSRALILFQPVRNYQTVEQVHLRSTTMRNAFRKYPVWCIAPQLAWQRPRSLTHIGTFVSISSATGRVFR